jgi:hypothetical protein
LGHTHAHTSGLSTPRLQPSLVLTPYLTLLYHIPPYLTPAFAALEQRHTNPLRRHGRLILSIRRTHAKLMTMMTTTSITRSAQRTGLLLYLLWGFPFCSVLFYNPHPRSAEGILHCVSCSARARPGAKGRHEYIILFSLAPQSQSSVYVITPTCPLDSQVVRLPLLVTGRASMCGV